MTDPCLSSMHLGFSARREHYRHAREALLGARGSLTLAGEQAWEPVGEVEDWPFQVSARPNQVLCGTKYLLVDPRTGRVHPLRVGLNRLGRFADNDLVFEEIYISRRHCVILVHARGGCELHDTASLNGTFLNGQRVREPVRLASGDCIEMCGRPLLFVSEQDYRAVPEDPVMATAFG
jgi:hypothetical protein